jgi:hypothetical protein
VSGSAATPLHLLASLMAQHTDLYHVFARVETAANPRCRTVQRQATGRVRVAALAFAEARTAREPPLWLHLRSDGLLVRAADAPAAHRGALHGRHTGQPQRTDLVCGCRNHQSLRATEKQRGPMHDNSLRATVVAHLLKQIDERLDQVGQEITHDARD